MHIDPVRFRAVVRYWDPTKGSGLAVADIPGEDIAKIGGLKQQRVHGTFGGEPFTSNVMPAGGGRLALSVTRAMLKAAGIDVGESADVELSAVGRD
jgi:hypothetical protein